MNTQSKNYLRYSQDPWLFLTECVKTLDQVDKVNPIKAFPNKEYLRVFSKVFMKYPLLAVPKSRRMTMSWAVVGMITWQCIFRRGTSWAMVSKKEEDANELVKRVVFILENIDPQKLPKDLIPQYKSRFNLIEFEHHSSIRGFPQGADQLRQFTFSGIFGDETAFWDQAKAFYSASLPTIDGGGQMVLVSSPAPGFFKHLCFDAFKVPGDFNIDERSPDVKELSQGIRVWQNKENKFLVFELHYLADPEKRDPQYAESLKAALPLSDYLREYELFWDTFSGQPVFPEFKRQYHVISEEPYPKPGLPMLIGFDFGLTPAAVIAQYEDGTLTIFKEYIEVNMGVERFLKKILPDMMGRYPTKGDLKKDWKCFIDPSGSFRKDTDESSCALKLAEAGFSPIPGAVTFEKRRQSVAKLLTSFGEEGPSFQIYAKGAPLTVKGLEGGYRFEDKYFELEPNKVRPIKDQYSHPQDALQYIAGGISTLSVRIKASVPRPEYTFARKHKKIS